MAVCHVPAIRPCQISNISNFAFLLARIYDDGDDSFGIAADSDVNVNIVEAKVNKQTKSESTCAKQNVTDTAFSRALCDVADATH